MKKFLLFLMLVLLTSCEGYQAVVYSYGVRQRPEPRRVYHFYTPYTYNPVVNPVYVYPSNYYYYPRHYNNRGGRRR